MSGQQYTRQVNIYVDSGQAQGAYDALEKRNNKLTESEERAKNKLNELKKSLETLSDKGAIDKVNKEIKATEVRIESLTATQKANVEQLDRMARKLKGELSPSYKDLVSTASQLNRELRKMSEQDPGFDAMKSKSIAANKALSDYNIGIGRIRSGIKEFAAEAGKIATGVLIGNTVQAGIEWATSSLTNFVKGQKELAREKTNIAKVTNLTADEVDALNKSFRDMDTETPMKGLRMLAKEAGRLGIEGSANIKKFVEQGNMIKVTLAEDLGENAVEDINKLATIFKTEMKNIGSALNDIEQKSMASATYQVDFMSRMAGVSQTVDLAADSILGFGSTLEQNKQPIEASSTALNTFFIDFVKNTETFGRSAGFAKGELSKLLSEKGTNEAFVQFLEKIKDGSKSSADLLRKLQEMGIDGARGASTFLTLANNTKMLREQQHLANDALTKGTSISQEYNKVNNDLSANIDKLGKRIAGWFAPLGNSIGSMLAKLLETKKTAADLFDEQDSKVKSLTGSLNPLLEKYESLKGKTNRTKEEQAELNKTIQAISTIMPSAITEFDKYGKAMDINADKVRGYMEAEKRRLAIYNKNAIEEAKIELKRVTDEIERIKKLQVRVLNDKFQDQTQKVPFTDQVKNPILAKLAKDLQEATDMAKELNLNIMALKGESIPTSPSDSSNMPVTDGTIIDSELEKNKKADEKRKAALQRIEDERQRQLEAQQRFQEKVLELSIAHRAAMEREDETEVAKIGIKFRRLRAELEKNYPILTDVAREMQQELNLIEGEQTLAAISDAEYKATLNTIKKFYAEKKAEVENDFAEGIINEKTMHETIKGFTRQEVDAKLAIAKDYVEKSKEAAKDITDFEADQAAQRVEIKKEELRKIQEAKDRAHDENDAQLGNDQYNANKTFGLGDDKEAEKARLDEKYQYEMDKAIEAGDSTVAIELNYAQAKDAIDQEYAQKKWKRASDFVSTAGSLFTQFLSFQQNAEADADARQLQKDRKANEQKKNEYKKQLDNKLISQKQFDELVGKSDEELAKKEADLKKKEFERNRLMKMIEIGISTAVGVMTAVAQSPMTGGLPGSAIAAGIGAVQLAFVAAQKAPELEYGDLLEGPSHAEGGMDVIDRKTGKKRYNIEGNELLLSKYFVGANQELIPSLLNASRSGKNLFEVMSQGTRAPRIDSQRIGAALESNTNPTAAADRSNTESNLTATFEKINNTLQRVETVLEELQNEGIKINTDKLARALVDANDASNLFV